MVIRAKYEDGVFKPLGRVKLNEGTVVEICLSVEKRKSGSARKVTFASLWKDRRHIKDGRSYVNQLGR